MTVLFIIAIISSNKNVMQRERGKSWKDGALKLDVVVSILLWLWHTLFLVHGLMNTCFLKHLCSLLPSSPAVFTGNSLECAASHGALLCVVQDRTVGWRKQSAALFTKSSFHNDSQRGQQKHFWKNRSVKKKSTYKEYFNVSSSSMIAAWFPQR